MNQYYCKIESEKIVSGLRFPETYAAGQTKYRLTEWDSDLTNMKNGYATFFSNPLKRFNGNLNSLVRGYDMFARTALTKWNTDMPLLVEGSRMFNGCVNLETFNGDLSSLVMASEYNGMFEGCTNLKHFRGKLSSLKYGKGLFKGCQLDYGSIQYIADYINDITSLDKTNDDDWSFENINDDNETVIMDGRWISEPRGRIDIGWDEQENINDDIRKILDKGWDVYVNDIQQDYNSAYYLYISSSYDIMPNSNYNFCPDASQWNSYVGGFEAFNDSGFFSGDNSITNVRRNWAWHDNTKKLFKIETNKIVNGDRLMMDNSKLTTWEGDLSNLITGYCMFNYCDKMTSFKSNLTSLEIGDWMFYNCTSLTTFDTLTPNLKSGRGMFSNHIGGVKLQQFNGDLNSLIDGEHMFYGQSLSSFSTNMPFLQNGYEMFSYCDSMTQFTGNVSSLINGENMFHWGMELSTFEGDLGSLKSGYEMFGYSDYGLGGIDTCCLSIESFEHIARTINDISGLDKSNDNDWIYEAYDYYAGNFTTKRIAAEKRGIIHISLGEVDLTQEMKDRIVKCYKDIKWKGWTCVFGIHGSDELRSDINGNLYGYN